MRRRGLERTDRKAELAQSTLAHSLGGVSHPHRLRPRTEGIQPRGGARCCDGAGVEPHHPRNFTDCGLSQSAGTSSVTVTVAACGASTRATSTPPMREMLSTSTVERVPGMAPSEVRRSRVFVSPSSTKASNADPAVRWNWRSAESKRSAWVRATFSSNNTSSTIGALSCGTQETSTHSPTNGHTRRNTPARSPAPPHRPSLPDKPSPRSLEQSSGGFSISRPDRRFSTGAARW